LAKLQVGALERVFHYVEEESVVVELQIFHIAVTHGLLGIGSITPVDSARRGRGVLRQHGEQIDSVGEISGIRLTGRSSKQRRQPIHRHRYLLRGAARLDMSRPAHHSGNAQAAFEKFGLFAGEGPGVGKAFAAVIAGENDDGISCGTSGVERFEDSPHLQVQLAHHTAVG